VLASDLRGTLSRKVKFLPASGRAFVQGLGRGTRATIEEEARYAERLRELPDGGSVEFF
jgi:chemotaxis receptor (MCP) glutamine deamidase CheD